MTQPIDTVFVEILPDFSGFVRVLRRDLNRVLRDLSRETNRAFDGVEDAAQDAGRSINISITIGARHAEKAIDDLADSARKDFNRIERAAGDAGHEIATGFGRQANTALQGALGTTTQLGQALIGLGLTAPSPAGLIAIGGIAAAIAAAIPIVVALAAAIADLVGLIGLLPAALGVLAAVITPVVVGFQNFGEAIKAISDGDPEKIAEALNKLSPAAAGVAREFAALLPFFRQLQLVTQEALFGPLTGALTGLAVETLPTLTQGFTAVAAAVGRVFAQFAQLVAEVDIQEAFGDVFESAVRIIEKFGPTAVGFFGVLVGVMEAGLPFVERMASAFNDALIAFTEFLGESLQSGDFNKFLEDAFATVKELVDLGRELGRFFVTIFAGTDDAGRSFLATLTDIVARFADFFESAEGQEQLRQFSDIVELVADALSTFFAIAVEVAGFTQDFIGFFVNAKNAVVDFFNAVDSVFSTVVVNIGKFLSDLPGIVKRAFQSAIDVVLFTIGAGIGLILFTFQVLPGKIAEFISTIPQRAASALTNFGPALIGVLTTAFGFARQFVTDRFNEIVAFIASVPSRLAGLGPTFLAAGAALIGSFANGFRRVGNFIGDVAGDIVGSIRGFLNRAIDRINSGIATLDLLLPGDLSRIPRLAEGGIVAPRPGGILANIGEGREAEIVAPLSKLQDMMAGPSVTFGPGSINVTFEGAVPTEAQARTTGEQVGVGIASALTRRNIRMQIRAI